MYFPLFTASMTRHSAFHQLQNLHKDEILSRSGIRYTGSQHFDVIFAVLFHHNVQNHFRKQLNFLETEITVGLLSTCLFKN